MDLLSFLAARGLSRRAWLRGFLSVIFCLSYMEAKMQCMPTGGGYSLE